MKKKLLIPFLILITHFTFAQKVYTGVVNVKVKSAFRHLCTNNSIELEKFLEIFDQFKINKVERMFTKIPINNKEVALKSDISLLYYIFYSSEINQKELINRLLKLKSFEYVEPQFQHSLLYTPNDPLSDSNIINQDYLKMFKAYQAWDITKGDTNILVAVSDKGVNLNHVDLQNTLYKNRFDTIDGIDNDNDGFIDNYLGYDLADDDNDPSETVIHGTYVTGCISADSDNGTGIAGIGFHTRVVPLKVFGANSSFKGYESIVFAADKGYDVINLSWGCGNCYSQTNQEIINYAVLDKDMVVVAAAGNTEAEIFFFPASYDNVLSVAGLSGNFRKAINISWNYNVDIMAKGVNVFTTSTAGGYGSVSGSSFASPMVAGGAALVKSVFPNYSALQIMEQLRVTTDSIYHIGSNSSYQDQLGTGSLNLYKAVSDTTTPSIRNLVNYNEIGKIYKNGDTILIQGNFINYLNPTTTNLKIELSSPSIYIQMIDSIINPGMINTLKTTDGLFSFRIINNPATNEKLYLKFSYDDTNYTDFEYKSIIINQDFLNINENDLFVTINSTGNIGWNFPDKTQGVGFSYKNFNNLLFESGLIIATDSTKVSNNLRTIGGIMFNQSFFTNQNIKKVNGSSFSDFKATTHFFDNGVPNTFVGVNIIQNIYAWNDAPNNNYIILEYEITNATPFTITNLYAGIFADWNLNLKGLDRAAWNHNKGFGYVYDAENKNIFTGIKPLLPYYGTYYALENQAFSTSSLEINNNFTNSEKFKTLSSIGTEKITAGEKYSEGAGDVAHTIGNKIGSLKAGETKIIAFALMAGDSIQDLENAATQAQLKYGFPTLLDSMPTVIDTTTICKGKTTSLQASGGNNYYVFYSKDDYLIMDTVLPHITPKINDTTVFYISFGDSIIPNKKAPLVINTYLPEVKFIHSPDTLFLLDENTVHLQNISPSYSSWEWVYNDSILSNASRPAISYSQEGVYFASLTITDANNCSNSSTDSIIVLNKKKKEDPESITEQLHNTFKTYPIPALQNIVVEQEGSILYPIEIYNNLGQIMYKGKAISNKEEISVSKFPNGLYTIKINTQTLKFIKK